MKTEIFQKNIKALIKEDKILETANSHYFHFLRNSASLNLIREIAVWWRAFQLEKYCPLTAGILKSADKYEQVVEKFYSKNNVSSFIEEAGNSFLQFVSENSDRKEIFSMASFELALFKVKNGDPNTYYINWEIDPYLLMHNILSGEKIPERNGEIYFTKISKDIKGYFEVNLLTGEN